MALTTRASLLALRAKMAGTVIRPLSLTSARLVDKPLFDEYTRRKSEFRVAAMDDRRVRERTALHIPCYVIMVVFTYEAWYVCNHWEM